MSQFKCLGTGSNGNCYLLTFGDGKTIILDAGVKIQKINKAVNLNTVELALITHKHKDHYESVEKLKKAGVEVIEAQEGWNIAIKGKYGINQFEVKHGDCLCNGYTILSFPEAILYVTDFTLCKWDLKSFPFTRVIVECNYIKSLTKSQKSGDLRELENIERHLDLDGCIKFLDTLDLSKCEEIVLVHFSDTFGDSVASAIEIKNRYKIRVLACRKYGGYDVYE